MTASSVVLLVIGLVLLGLSVWSRASASSAKWWAGPDNRERFVLVGAPCVGLALVLVGLLPVVGDSLTVVLSVVALVLVLVALAWGPVGLALPAWAVPDSVTRRRGRRA